MIPVFGVRRRGGGAGGSLVLLREGRGGRGGFRSSRLLENKVSRLFGRRRVVGWLLLSSMAECAAARNWFESIVCVFVVFGLRNKRTGDL